MATIPFTDRVGLLETKYDGLESGLSNVEDKVTKLLKWSETVDGRLDKMDGKLDAVNERLDSQDTKLDEILNRLP